MSDAQIPVHYVVTHEHALKMIREHDHFWVSNCGCRERKGKCERSKMDVCLMFDKGIEGSGSGKRELILAEVLEILQEAEAKHLVARPFRNEERTETEGVCFCCDDCCAYFLDPQEQCDKGEQIERTNLDLCDNCAICTDVCYFGARKINDGELKVDQEKCYGCGLCADVCPLECVKMEQR